MQVTGNEDFNYFMTLVYPSDNLRVMDYNRVLKDLNGLTSEQFIKKLSESYDLSKTAKGYPKRKHQTMLLIED